MFVKMKIKVSSTEYEIIIDTKETTLVEWLMCLEAQYPLLEYKKVENTKNANKQQTKELDETFLSL